jgi:hypothetical protein
MPWIKEGVKKILSVKSQSSARTISTKLYFVLQNVKKISNNKIQPKFIFSDQHKEDIKNFESLKRVI